jgi:3,4-dihydroxy-2-butanone 4-phosphate synthase
MSFATIEEAAAELKEGRMIIIADFRCVRLYIHNV